MDRDTFIITVYCLVVDFYKMVKEKHKIRLKRDPLDLDGLVSA